MAVQLSIKQRTTTALSTAMRMSFELLKLPIDELREKINKEIEENPAIHSIAPMIPGRTEGGPDMQFVIDNARSRGKTLQEHLEGELRMASVNEHDRRLASAIIGELDERGYFVGEIASMAMALETTVEELEKARRRVMQIDPKGCGARDLHECLLAQIGVVPPDERDQFVAGIEHILDETLPPSKRVSPMAKKYILKMRVNPGKLFQHVKVDYVTPDVSVNEAGEVMVDTAYLPRISVSPKYVEMARDRELDEATRRYAAEKVKRAREFCEAVEQRKVMLEKICEAAIARQFDHLKTGEKSFETLSMSEVAKIAGCHVSTVSRAAERKFVKTPYGVLQLKKFFPLRESAPYEKLKTLIAAFPEGQEPSDKQLAEMMEKEGYHFSRRWVNKWRNKLK